MSSTAAEGKAMRKSRSGYGFRWAVSSALAMGLMLLASKVSAQATLVQAATPAGAGTATSVTGAFTSAPTPGNVIVAIVGDSAGAATFTPSPATGWRQDILVTTGPSISIFHRIVPNSPPSSYTFLATSGNLGLQLYELGGLDTAANTLASLVDNAGGNNGTGNSVNSGSVTTTNANDFLIAGLVANRNHAAPNFSSPTNGFAEFSGADFTGGSAPSTAFAGLYRGVTATGTFDTTETTGNSPAWAGAIVAFKQYCPPPGNLVIPQTSDMKANGTYLGSPNGWSDATNTNYNFRLAGLPGVVVNNDNTPAGGDPTGAYNWDPTGVQYYSAVAGDTIFINADFRTALGHGNFGSADASNEYVTVGLANKDFVDQASDGTLTGFAYNSEMRSTAGQTPIGDTYVKFIQRNGPNGVSVLFHDNDADGDQTDATVTGATTVTSVQIQFQVGLDPTGAHLPNITDGGRMRFALNGSGTWSQWFRVYHDFTNLNALGGATIQLQAFSNDGLGAVTAHFGDVEAVVINTELQPRLPGL